MRNSECKLGLCIDSSILDYIVSFPIPSDSHYGKPFSLGDRLYKCSAVAEMGDCLATVDM